MSKRNNHSQDHPDPFFDKGLPHAVDMERGVLGAILLNDSICDEARLLLQPSDFFLNSNRIIFEKMLFLKDHQQPIELLTLQEALRAAGEFEQVGGATYIASLISGVPRTDTIEPYAQVIRRRAKARARINAAAMVTAENFEDPDDPELGSKAEARFGAIEMQEEMADVKPLVYFAENYVGDVKAARDRGERITGIPTGYDGFDTRTLGLQRQELTIIAARISIGKTTLAQNMSQNIVADPGDYRLMFWSGEMRGERIAGKAIAKQSHVDSFRMRSGQYDEGRVYDALQTFDRWGDRFALCDKPGISVAEFRALCRWQKIKHGLDVAVADYLLLFANPRGITDRRESVSQNTWMLKLLARELDIAVVVLHQLNRAPDSRARKDQRPRLSDLAESGDVERHADVVTFLWRDREPKKGEENITRAYVAKQRNGPPGEFGLVYIKPEDRFENLADERQLFNTDAAEDD